MVRAKEEKNLKEVEKKANILLLNRLKKKENLIEAIEIQDSLSEKSDSDWSGESEIRKWREKR